MAKAYTEQQKAEFLNSYGNSGKSIEDWCKGKDVLTGPAPKRPTLSKMTEWLNERKGVVKDKRTRKQLLTEISELAIKVGIYEKMLKAA